MSSWLEFGPTAVGPPPPRALRHASVLGLGSALPDTVVSSDDIAGRLGLDPGWIEKRTGIASRRHLAEGETLSELATAAAATALADAQVDPRTLDVILAATTTADDVLPNLAPVVGAHLGAEHAGGYDVGAACTGFLAALQSGAGMIESGRAERVLVIGADALSRNVDPADRGTSIIFGDGAGAVVLGAQGDGWVGPIHVRSDGAQAKLVWIPGGTRKIVMDGHGTFLAAVAKLTEATREAAAEAELLLDELDLFVYHQANSRILRSLTERLGLDPAKVVNAIGEVGNTSAASLPLALDQARREGRLRPGSRVLLGAVGAGFTWGAGVVTW